MDEEPNGTPHHNQTLRSTKIVANVPQVIAPRRPPEGPRAFRQHRFTVARGEANTGLLQQKLLPFRQGKRAPSVQAALCAGGVSDNNTEKSTYVSGTALPRGCRFGAYTID